MQKILFPTDFSENSINAFVYALRLAENINAEVITLHVYQYPIIENNYIDVPLYQTEVYQSLELNDFENYKSHIPVLRRAAIENNLSHIQFSNVLMTGDLIPTILEVVKEQRIDYVVMGTHGASGWKEFLFGSSAATVMTETNAFVMAVPESSHYHPIRKIGFTTQFQEADFAALKEVLAVAKGFNASVECLYVQTPDNEVERVVIADWKLLLREENLHFHIIENNDVEQSIINFIDQNNLDLLALVNHRRGFWESLFHTSLTKKLANHLTIPLLALHEKK